MKAHTASTLFQQKRELETILESTFPNEYYSKYSLVTFNDQISYYEAMTQGRAQDKAILNLLDDKKINASMDAREMLTLVQQATYDILHDDRVAKNLNH